MHHPVVTPFAIVYFLFLSSSYTITAFEMKFLCLLSPTKQLAEKSCPKLLPKNVSLLPTRVKALESPRSVLLKRMQQLSENELKTMMGLSDKLAVLNFQRYQNFEEQPYFEAGRLFDGPSFKKLNIDDFSESELNRLDSSLCILSGLYGILMPRDPMQPYRLEMGTRLRVDDVQTLYQFWQKHSLTQQIVKLGHGRCILNCASQEYSKVVQFEELRSEGVQTIDIVFQANKGGRVASVYAKQARGLFVRFVAKANPSNFDDLQQFTGDGHYLFASKSNGKIIFERYAEAQGAGDDALWNTDANLLATKKRCVKTKSLTGKRIASAKEVRQNSDEKRRRTRSSIRKKTV
jgi:hypothetical protein